MSTLESIITVNYKQKMYTVAKIKCGQNDLPIALDREIYKELKKLNKKWYVNDLNQIYCLHQINGKSFQIYMHNVVMKIANKSEYKNGVAINHINNIHLDNRINNLQFDLPNKNINKSIKKKKRTIDLSNSNINVDDLPTYIWYAKPDKTHGERFIIEIPNIIQKRTSSSKKLSLRYKLEEAKKYLRHVQKHMPEISNQYSMNGDLTMDGAILRAEYLALIKKAGYDEKNIIAQMFINSNASNDVLIERNTKKCLKENLNGLNDFEKFLLNSYDPSNNHTLDLLKLTKEYNRKH